MTHKMNKKERIFKEEKETFEDEKNTCYSCTYQDGLECVECPKLKDGIILKVSHTY